jgi:cell division protein FtsB
MNHEISGHLLKRNQDLHQANDELEQTKTKLHDLTQAIKLLESSN